MRDERAVVICKAAGLERFEAYSLQYVENRFWPRTTQRAADRSSQQKRIPYQASIHGRLAAPLARFLLSGG
jgi:hypothetical protein